MATTVTLRQILDRKQWEMLAPLAGMSGFGLGYTAQSTLFDQYQMHGDGLSTFTLYDPRVDAYSPLPSSGLTTFGSGTSGGAICYHPHGPTGTASAGTSTTITTTSSLPGSLAGYVIRITAGTGAGQERTIAGNTYGANSVITVTSAWSVTPDATSVYLLITGRFYVANGAPTAGMKYYDVATNTWSASLSMTGVTAGGGEWRLAATPSYGATIATGTVSAGASTTLTNSAKSWATNQWTNYQVRIISGTGAGQVRTIASNTGTVLTVSAAWGTTPDATSAYNIEGNDDYLYFTGGGGLTLYRYSISGNTWSPLSPGTARTAAPSVGMSLNWISVASDSTWADETSIKNGRYLYSFQGGSVGNLSYYDIAANTWVNLTTTYQRGGSGFAIFTSGWHNVADREFIYLIQVGTATLVGRACFRFNCVTQTLEPFATWTYPVAGSASTGNRAGIATYTDGGTTLRWVYVVADAATMFRIMVI